MNHQTLLFNPNETLEFFGPFNTKSKSRLLLENRTRKRFCFKIKSNAPKNRILVSPKSGFVEHNQNVNILFELLPFGSTLISKTPPEYGIMIQSVVVPSTQVDLKSAFDIVSHKNINAKYLKTRYNQSSVPRSLDTTEEELVKENIPYNGQVDDLNIGMVQGTYRRKASNVLYNKSNFVFQGSGKAPVSQTVLTKQPLNVATVAFSSDNTSTQEFQLTPGGQKIMQYDKTNKGKLVKFSNPLQTGAWISGKYKYNEKISKNDWNNEQWIKDGNSKLDDVYIRYKALYNYETSEVEGLSFKAGDVILVNSKDHQPDPGWLFAQLQDQTGWVPENYLEKIVETVDYGQTDWGNPKQVEKTDEVQNVHTGPTNEIGSGVNEWDNIDNQIGTLPEQNVWGPSGDDGWGTDGIVNNENQDLLQDGVVENDWGTNADLNANVDGNIQALKLKYQALYDYDSGDSESLAFKVGDIIVVDPNDVADAGWLIGSLDGKVGWVPDNYVAKFESGTEETIHTAKENDWGTNADGKANVDGEVQVVDIKYKASYDYESGEPESLAFKAGDIIIVNPNDAADPGWLIGSLDGKVGWLPENYVTKLESGTEETMYTANLPQPICEARFHNKETEQMYMPGIIPNRAGSSSIESLMDAMNRRDTELGNQRKDAILLALIIFLFGIILGKAAF